MFTLTDIGPSPLSVVVGRSVVEGDADLETVAQQLLKELGMHSLENLRGIPKEKNFELHLSTIRKEWNKFYRQNAAPTKQQLLGKATEIDNMLGSQFNPPIRD